MVTALTWVAGDFEGDYEGTATPDKELPPEKSRFDLRLFDVTILRGTLKNVRCVTAPDGSRLGDAPLHQVEMQELYVLSGAKDAEGRPEWNVCRATNLTLFDWRVVTRTEDGDGVLGQIAGRVYGELEVEGEGEEFELPQGAGAGRVSVVAAARDGWHVPEPAATARAMLSWWVLLMVLLAFPLVLTGGLGFALLAVLAVGFVMWNLRWPISRALQARWPLIGVGWCLVAGLVFILFPPTVGACPAALFALLLGVCLFLPLGGRRGGTRGLLALVFAGGTLLLPVAWCGLGTQRPGAGADWVAAPHAPAPLPEPEPKMMALNEALADPDLFYRNCSRRVTLSADLLFDSDEVVLGPRAGGELVRLGRLLRYRPGAHVLLEGHADTIGDREHNQELSAGRALAVKRWLTAKGRVKPGLIETVGFGSSRPVVPFGDAAAQRRNRRVDVAIICADDWDGGVDAGDAGRSVKDAASNDRDD